MSSARSDRLSSPAISPTEVVSAPRALEHYDPKPLRKVPIERWRHVLARAAPLPPSLAEPAAATLDDVVAALTRGALPPHLHDLLQVLHDMGTAPGAHVLHDGAIELGIDRDDWPDAVEELAVEIWARARVDARYRKLLLVAEVGLHARAAETRYREYFAAEARAIENPEVRRAVLEDDLSAWFEKEKMGRRARILLHPEDDRAVFCVFHGTRRQYAATFVDDGSEGMLGFRPLVCDVITYEPFSGRLRVTAGSKRIVEQYRRLFGATLFGDDAFFTARPRYDLGPIATAIQTGSLPPPADDSVVRSVNLVDCVWTTAEGVQHHLHGLSGRDCAEQARRAQFRVERDRLTQVTLAFTFRTAGRPERTEIVLRTGNQFDCRKPARRDAIEEYLTQIGVRAPGHTSEAAAPATQDLFGARSVARWQFLLGDRVAEACRRELLRPVSRPRVAPPGEPHDVEADAVTQLELGGETVALARDASGEIRVVRPDELLAYELNPRRLAELVRDELGCGLSLRDLPFAGGFDLGPFELGSVTVRPFLVTAVAATTPRAAIPSLEAIAGPRAKWIVLLPPKAAPDEWGLAAPLRALLPPYHARTDIVRTLGLGDQVTALDRAGGARLVVDAQRHAAWLDGVALDLSPAERQLLELLARATVRGQSLPAAELARALCGEPENEDLVRQRVRELSKTVRGRMRTEGRASPESGRLVRSFRKGTGYRLVLVPYVE